MSISNQTPIHTAEYFTYSERFLSPETGIDFHLYDYPRTILHNHDYFEVFLVTKGPLRYICNGKEYVLQKRSLVFVLPEDAHQFDNPSNTTQQHINLAFTVPIAKLFCDFISPTLFTKLKALQKPLIIELSAENYKWLLFQTNQVNITKPDSANYISILKTLLFNTLSLIYRFLHTRQDGYPLWLSSLLEKINSAEYISINASQLYAMCPYSVPVVVSEFKKHLHQTPIQYLTERKIYFACNLLRNTEYTTLHISALLGYDSLSHFNHTFKKIMHCTPREYRKDMLTPSSS